MKFLLDESAEVQIAKFLESLGYNIKIVQRDFAIGVSDDWILHIGYTEQRIVITNDRDFGELVFKKKRPHFGVVYFRFPLDSNAEQKIASLKKLFSTHAKDLGKFLVVTPRGIRIKT